MNIKFELVTLNWYDYFMWLLYVTIGAGFLYFYKSYKEKTNKYLIQGYFVKMIGGFLLVQIYVYYYKSGDTTDYYFASNDFANIYYYSPKLYFELFFSDSEQAIRTLIENKLYLRRVQWTSEEWFMARISSPLSLLGFNSYLGMTFFFTLISYFAALQISKVYNAIMPNRERIVFIIVFFSPSVLIWGGGVLKDTFTLASFNILCFLFYKTLTKQQSFFWFLIKGFIPGFIIYKLKVYILICFIPLVFISFFVKFIRESKHPVLKFMILPYMIIVMAIGLFFATSYLMNSSEDYKQEQLITRIEGFKSWHSELGGSNYDLGEIEYSELGLLKKMPQAINVTLFRPYLWECKTIFSAFAGLESLFFLILTVIVLVKYRSKVFSKIYDVPFLFGSFIFIILFSYALGISAYNFGALMRFKIPMVSLYLFLFVYANNELKNKLTRKDIKL